MEYESIASVKNLDTMIKVWKIAESKESEDNGEYIVQTYESIKNMLIYIYKVIENRAQTFNNVKIVKQKHYIINNTCIARRLRS